MPHDNPAHRPLAAPFCYRLAQRARRMPYPNGFRRPPGDDMTATLKTGGFEYNLATLPQPEPPAAPQLVGSILSATPIPQAKHKEFPMKPRSPNSLDSHIGTRIRMRRLELGISQQKLGESLGVSFQQVQKYEIGVNRVGAGRIQEIAQVLRVDVGFFYQSSPRRTAVGKTGKIDSIMDQFMATKDGLVIAGAFTRIQDANIRRIIASAIGNLGQAFATLNAPPSAKAE